MKRRCNICLQSKQHTSCERYNNEVTICYQCAVIIKRIVNDENIGPF